MTDERLDYYARLSVIVSPDGDPAPCDVANSIEELVPCVEAADVLSTTEMDDMRRRDWHHQHMYQSLVCELVRNTVRQQAGDPDWRKDKALLIAFKLGDYHEEGHRVLQVLFYAPSNYVAVLSRFEDEHKPPHFRPGDWKLEGYHDVCWTDSFRTLLDRHWDDIVGNDVGQAYQVVGLREEDQEYLRKLIRDQRP